MSTLYVLTSDENGDEVAVPLAGNAVSIVAVDGDTEAAQRANLDDEEWRTVLHVTNYYGAAAVEDRGNDRAYLTGDTRKEPA